MSEIEWYFMTGDIHGDFKEPQEVVLRKDHEAAIEQVLADAKARIEGLLENGHNTGSQDWYFNEGLREALAALTQPQTEKKCACVGPENALKPDEWHSPTCGGGAATAAGVADALTLTPGEARNLVDAAMGDEHDPQLLDSTVKRIGDEADRQLAEPSPYAKAFRERVCPVPEFPSIRETAHEAIIEGGCCIQCGLPNNSETVLFHSCQAGAPADPTCPNTGHKFSHCDCDLGIEKEES